MTFMDVNTDKLTWLSRALSLMALAICSYLAYYYLQNKAPVCTIVHGCSAVEHSRWARPDGVPLPLFGIAGYMVLFITVCMRGQRARFAAMLFASFAIAMSICLTYLQLNVIRAVCIWCVSLAVCALVDVIVNSARYVRGDLDSDDPPARDDRLDVSVPPPAF